MSYEPLHHKYRPKSFSQLVGQSAIATTLTNAINTSRIAPAYLFTGPRGTGKTSSARILAKSLNCLSSPNPTATPCGKCDVCQGITKGYTVDVIEIDAASNTGVENVRDIIEKAQFAPVQCRYKVYVIDECLTGDSLVLTSEGLVRIDNPEIKGKKVLSYNDSNGNWEYKQVVRWFDQGERQTLVIKTTLREIRCTGNHLIRTDQGWIPARDVKEGHRILSPANAVVAPLFTNTVKTDASEDLYLGTSSKAIPTDKKHTTSNKSWNKPNHFVPSAVVDVEKSLISQNICSAKAKDSAVYYTLGKNTHTGKDTAIGNLEQSITSLLPKFYQQKHWDLFTEPCLETAQSVTLTNIADIQDWHLGTERYKGNGQSINPPGSLCFDLQYSQRQTEDMVLGRWQSTVTHAVIPSLKRSLISLNHTKIKKSCHWNGLIKSHLKDLLGGIWMMGHLTSIVKKSQQLNYTQKDFLSKKTISWLIGSQQLDIQQKFTVEVTQESNTSMSTWEQKALKNGWQTLENTQFPQWTTSLERVESVTVGKLERVYDIEVEDNHNFVANGLLIHNCHMLSTQAFNALLKTLEEPPKHIVFILATTDPQRVLPTIISRCQRFDFRRIPLDDMVSHLTDIAIKENINITTEAITLIAQLSQGGLRDAESLLDQLSLLPEQVNPNNVWDLVGTVSEHDLYWLFKAIAADNAEELIDTTRQILDRGREPLTILQNLAGFYRDLLIAKTASNRGDLVACTQETWQAMVELANHIDIHGILAGQQHLRNAEVQLKNTTQPRLWLEVTLLGLLPSAQQQVAPSTQKAPIQNQPHNNNSKTNGKAPRELANNHTAPVNPSQPSNNNLPTNNHQPTNNQPVANNHQPTNNHQPQTNNHQPANNQPANNQQNDLAQTWQEVLSHLEPISRREMLRQMCNVIEIRSEFARLGVKQAWHKRVQEDLPIIRRAFKVTFNREITVNLEVTNSGSNRTKEGGVTYTTEEPPPFPVESQHAPATNGNLTEHHTDNVQNNTSNLTKETLQNHNLRNNTSQNDLVQNPVQNTVQDNSAPPPAQNSVQNSVQNGSKSVAPPKYTHTQDTFVQPQPVKETHDVDVSNFKEEAPVVESTTLSLEPVITVSSLDVEKVWHAAERLAQFFDGQVIGYNEDAAEFGDSAAPSDLIDVVESDDE